jgi:outer membrane receptor for Fe3+-dicitrate
METCVQEQNRCRCRCEYRSLRRLRSAWPLIALPFAVQAQQQAAAVLPPVQVIGVSPLPGQGIDRDLLPYTTHSVRRERLDEANADNVSDFMSRRLPGVQVNDVQGSPFQGDLTYRGFRASPLLGAGQGLSVYLDGVRVNEPFGDVINWDMLPEFSVNTLTLVPGANPAFGLNTLGGALSLTTHDGTTAPGLRGEVSAGSFGRRRVDLSYGQHGEDGWHGYLGTTGFKENGWRDESAGWLGNVLAKAGRSTGDTDWSAGLLWGRSKLVGNGLVPAYALEEGAGGIVRVPDLQAGRREAVYTHPDRTTNELGQLTFTLRHRLDAGTEVSTLAYLRSARRDTVNGDEAEEPDGDENASLNTTATRQESAGVAASLSVRSGPHQWQAGATLDAARVRYEQLEQEASFTPGRGVTAGDAPPELSARVSGRSMAMGLYVTDTWALAERTHLTGTLRYNHARLSNTLTSVDDDTGEVAQRPKESFRYNSLNPALGIAHRLDGGPTLFANVARNNRVPTVIELGCADPEEPCRLPAGLQADPFLEQVTSVTAELGLRWPVTQDLRVELSAYRTDNRNDILFRSVSVAGQQGYFANFPRTRHQGLDAGLQGRVGALDFDASYSWLEATYQAEGVLRQGERNVGIGRGTRIAGLPRHSLKLAADWRLSAAWSVGADLQAFSSRGTAGNEDGLIEDGEDERVDLRLPGYAVVNLRASWRVPGGGREGRGWEFFAKVNNVFDRHHHNFAALAETVFDANGQYSGSGRDAVFAAPGAPRALLVGVRHRY